MCVCVENVFMDLNEFQFTLSPLLYAHNPSPSPPQQIQQEQQPVSCESLEGEYLKKHSIRSRGEIRGGGIFNRAL